MLTIANCEIPEWASIDRSTVYLVKGFASGRSEETVGRRRRLILGLGSMPERDTVESEDTVCIRYSR